MKTFINKHIDFRRNWIKSGLSKSAYFELLRYPGGYLQPSEVEFRGRPTYFASPYWFLHSVREIFVDEVYRFDSRNEQPRIIDCGANIGLSVLYFKELYPNAKIIAFEPDAAMFDLLQKNIAERRLSDVEILNRAVWLDDSVLSFEVEGALGGKVADGNGKGGKQIEVRGARLRDLLVQHVDFLKIDIEGAEYLVLDDCKDRLRNVENLFIEYHCDPHENQRLNTILSWISGAGFRYYISEAARIQTHPFISKGGDKFDMQLNISCYWPESSTRS